MFHAALLAAADLLAAEPNLADIAPRLRHAAALHADRETAMRWAYFLDGAMRTEHDADMWAVLDAAGRELERALEADSLDEVG